MNLDPGVTGGLSSPRATSVTSKNLRYLVLGFADQRRSPPSLCYARHVKQRWDNSHSLNRIKKCLSIR